MRKRAPKKLALGTETLHALDPAAQDAAGGYAIRCSVQVCPLTNPSYAPCSGTCTCSCP